MNKGLASFEFLVTLGMILMVTTAVISFSLEESRETLVLSSLRSTVNTHLSLQQLRDSDCQNSMINSYTHNEDTITIDVTNNCDLDTSKIIDEVERDVCGSQPNNNNLLECGTKDYEVQIQ